jgi:hypothetical protein
MSDGLTATPTHRSLDRRPEPSGRRLRSAWVVAPVQALVVLAVFTGVGAFAGWLWYRLWDVPHGVVSGGQWYTDEAGLRDDFDGTGWYVALALVAGLLLGVLSAWLLRRSELVTLLAVTAGSVLAAWVMLRVGHHLSPPDPDRLARTADDGTKLAGALRLHSWVPKGAFPFGALIGLALVYGLSATRTPAEVRTEPPWPYDAPPRG